jgi:proteasome assembly chaperone (PAC2) family protein
MDDIIEILEIPQAKEIYMIAGWQQWADAGAISSGLPEYLIELTGARKIGEIKPDGFYLFQIPGTHHLLRPEIKLKDGYRMEMSRKKNEFYYTGDSEKGLLIFAGDEPHLNADRYTDAFFEVVKAVGIKRGAAIGGVYGAVPYDKDRSISCTFSMPYLQEELNKYAVRFSNYEGGTTISAYMVHKAEAVDLEFLGFHALVPLYDLSQLSRNLQGLGLDDDYKAWYDLMRRFNHMFGLNIDLSDLAHQSDELVGLMEAKIAALAEKMPQANIKSHLAKMTEDFEEKSFMPLDDVWGQALGDLFTDGDE